MIITLVTSRYIVQVSDRRITYGHDRVGEVMNKAVIIDRSGCAAYTGLAFLDGKTPTDEFLMEAIDETAVDGEDTFDRLARHASRAVRLNKQLPPDMTKRMAIARTSFVVAEFVQATGQDDTQQTAARVPVLTVVSNAQTDMSETWATHASKKFQRVHEQVHPGTWLMHVAGQPMPATLRRNLERNLSRAIRRCTGPEPAARLMGRAIQEVSETNAWVGPSVNCVMIRDMELEPWHDEHGQLIETGPGIQIPIAEYGLREANYFLGPRSDIQPEPVYSVFLPHPEHPQVANGPAFVLRGMFRGRGFMAAPDGEIAEVARKAEEDLRAGRTVDLTLPKRHRKRPEPRVLP